MELCGLGRWNSAAIDLYLEGLPFTFSLGQRPAFTPPLMKTTMQFARIAAKLDMLLEENKSRDAVLAASQLLLYVHTPDDCRNKYHRVSMKALENKSSMWAAVCGYRFTSSSNFSLSVKRPDDPKAVLCLKCLRHRKTSGIAAT